jgi:hypothetical protein
MTPRPIEFASLGELQRRVVDTNGCDHEADTELRRRQLAARTGARRSPADRLRWLEQHKTPDLRSPREKLIALEARQHVTAHGIHPRQLLLQLHAQRIVWDFEDW